MGEAIDPLPSASAIRYLGMGGHFQCLDLSPDGGPSVFLSLNMTTLAAFDLESNLKKFLLLEIHTSL